MDATSKPATTATAMRRPSRSGGTNTVASDEYGRAGAGDRRVLTEVGVRGRSSSTLGTSSPVEAFPDGWGVCSA